MAEKIIIFDTTLRDGEQSPGASLNLAEKMEVARALRTLNVDVIEAGFPITSPGDFEAVKTIAQEIKGPIICGLARAVDKDIDRCWEAVKHSDRPRIHTFIATSDVHVEKKLRKSREEVIGMAVNAVQRARKYCDDVEFSPEDAARTDLDYMCAVVEACIEAGATTINIPDTVGYSNPWEFGARIAYLFKKVKNAKDAIISVHCHNDLGLSVANSLAAIREGARQVECTVNGIGERAGNASLEEVVMNIHTRPDYYAFKTDINLSHIYPASRLVSNLTGIVVQPNKAIVGGNAFAHEAGIHQDGVLKLRQTYEVMDPKQVGWKGTSMVLGKHSGRHALRQRLVELGYQTDDAIIERVYERFKVLADQKKNIYDEDLEALVEDESVDVPQTFILDTLEITSGNKIAPKAKVILTRGTESLQAEGTGDGPVDAAYKTIAELTGFDGELADYRIKAVTAGTDAQGEVTVTLRKNGNKVTGRGAHTDIIVASAKAYVNAVNKLAIMQKRDDLKDAV